MRRLTTALSRRQHSGPKPLADCGSFATLAQRAGVLQALDRALRQTLPAPLRDQVRFADLRHDRLVFLASSPAWAARLRLMQTGILASAQAVGVRASAVRIVVATPDPVAEAPALRKRLSPTAASHLRAAAACFPDPELRAMFQSLAATAASPAMTVVSATDKAPTAVPPPDGKFTRRS